jgi:nucleoside-diphosphate-sugar epimerase
MRVFVDKDPIARRRVLVTGGAGFIGSHLVSALIAKGYEVDVLDNLSSGKAEWLNPFAKLIIGDVENKADCARAMEGCSAIIHLAAQSRSAPSVLSPERTICTNVMGTANVLSAAYERGIKKIVYAASATYYGNCWNSPQPESLKPDLLNSYALSKYVGEQLCELYDRMYGMEITRLRYFSVYGPRQPETGVYALVIGVFLGCLRTNEVLPIYGDGRQRRDFVHIRDVVEATIAAMESKMHGWVLNVGSGVSTSINDLANMFPAAGVAYLPARACDARETCADLSTIKLLLKWEPKITLQEGLQELLHASGIDTAMHD